MKLYNQDNLNSLRNQGDELAESAVLTLLSRPELVSKLNLLDMFPDVSQIETLPVDLKLYFESFNDLPSWINVEKVKIAHDFFDRNANYYLSMLGFYSLPYCYAFADGAQVLYRSRRITEDIGMRLAETTLFVMDVFMPGNFLQHADGLWTIAKVRLIHAYSRYFIKLKSKDWDQNWGVPINQEDMLGTNLAFSLLVIRGFEKLGVFPGKKILEAVLHYWKIVGHFMGIETQYWPDSAKEAYELEKLIRKRHLKSSEAGHFLVSSLINFYKFSIPDSSLANLSETIIAYFVGEKVSSTLGIKQYAEFPKPLYNFILQFSFFRQSGLKPSYHRIRRDFQIQTRNNFGKDVSLNIPALIRS
nr:oxygenase MpaB family protein [Belliella kenyensis]